MGVCYLIDLCCWLIVSLHEWCGGTFYLLFMISSSFFLIHVCVVCVIFSLCFSAMDYFSLFFGGLSQPRVLFIMSIDVCNRREDIRYFYVVLVFQGFLFKFVSLVYQKVWFRLSGSPFCSFPFCSRWFDEQSFGSKSSKKYSSISFGKCLEWRACYEYSSTSFLGRGRVGFTFLSLIFPLELGPKTDFRCSRVSLTREVRRSNLWGRSKRFPGAKVS